LMETCALALGAKAAKASTSEEKSSAFQLR
jgi:hypothetical protein